MQETGTLKVVASTGGLKFIGEGAKWMNPAKDITAEGMKHLNSLRNKRVVIDFNDKGKYIRCELAPVENRDIPTYPANEQKSAPEPAKTGQVDRETSIVRQTCLKAASEVIKAGIFPMPTEGYRSAKEIEDIVLIMAAKFEEWVNRK